MTSLSNNTDIHYIDCTNEALLYFVFNYYQLFLLDANKNKLLLPPKIFPNFFKQDMKCFQLDLFFDDLNLKLNKI